MVAAPMSAMASAAAVTGRARIMSDVIVLMPGSPY
jgi:hypothetical protein